MIITNFSSFYNYYCYYCYYNYCYYYYYYCYYGYYGGVYSNNYFIIAVMNLAISVCNMK